MGHGLSPSCKIVSSPIIEEIFLNSMFDFIKDDFGRRGGVMKDVVVVLFLESPIEVRKDPNKVGLEVWIKHIKGPLREKVLER